MVHIEKLVLQHFRNYAYLELALPGNLNLLVGGNGQGKTNILEAVYLLCTGRSHRTNRDAEMVQWGFERGRVDLTFTKKGLSHHLTIVLAKPQKRQVVLNGSLTRFKEVIGTVNAVLFSPEDLLLVKGAPNLRRRFLDMELSQASPSYYHLLLSYHRALAQRNNLLRLIREERGDAATLNVWDEQVAHYAAAIVSRRLAAVRQLSILARLLHRQLAGDTGNLAVLYHCHGRLAAAPETAAEVTEQLYRQALAQNRQQDIVRGYTSVGPHRDDFSLVVDDVDMRTYGSQGQQRTAVLALKLAELEFIKAQTGEYPVLLLDDVMSELDRSRRSQLLHFIQDRIQTIITATDREFFPDWPLNDKCQVFAVRQGEVTGDEICNS